MKKLKTMLAAMLSVLILAGCGGPTAPTEASTESPTEAPTQAPTTAATETPTQAAPPAEEDQSLRNLRREMEPSAAIGGIFYLGCFDGEPMTDAFWSMVEENGYLERYPFLQYLDLGHFIETDGCEVYCIVPADPKARVTVTQWDEVNYTPGDVLYDSPTGEPILVRCNVSDILPNLAVTIEDSYGNLLENYRPCISTRDGTVALPLPFEPLMLDLSIYYGDPVIFFDLYIPNEHYDGFDVVPAQAEFLDPELVAQLLIEHHVLPEDTILYNYSFDYDRETIYLNFNQAFEDHVSSPDVSWETYTLSSIARSYISAFPEIKAVDVTVEGEPLVTANYSYDTPFYWGDLDLYN